jgi:hypothetical protein
MADERGTDERGTDERGTDERGTDEPGTDEPGTDEPGTDEPGADEPGELLTSGVYEPHASIAVEACRLPSFVVAAAQSGAGVALRWRRHALVPVLLSLRKSVVYVGSVTPERNPAHGVAYSADHSRCADTAFRHCSGCVSCGE